MSSVKTVGSVLVKYNDEVLLCKRSPKQSMANMWSIPGGHIHKNEPPRIGAEREFFEETNLEAKDLHLVGFLQGKDPRNETLVYVFLMEVNERIEPDLNNAKDGHEHVGCKYFKLDNLPIKDSDDQLRQIIKKVLKK